jgi:hypothetical protein
MIHKSLRRKMLHMEFLNHYPLGAISTVLSPYELNEFLNNLESKILIINQKVNHLFEICQNYNAQILEKQ